MQEVKRTTPKWITSPNNWSPRQSIMLGVLLAFFVFLGLDALEGIFLAHPDFQIRALHFARGFCATAGGMILVWWIMQKKESELISLRDYFASQLTEKTKELSTTTELNEKQKKWLEAMQATLLQQRKDFLAVLSHRLRTPIIANRRTAQLLLEGVFGPLSGKQPEVLTALLENNDEIDRLLDMLIDIYKYKISANELDFNLIELNSIVAGLDALKSKATEKGLDLRVEIHNGLTAYCDPKELSKLVVNLTENAIKHARTKVRIASREVSPDEVELSFEDDGQGISNEDLTHIFDRFSLISVGGKYAPITGTGLCLCHEIARAHNGNIACKSEVGKGTVFLVTLPKSAHSTNAN